MTEPACEPKVGQIGKYLGCCLLSLVIASMASANDGPSPPKGQVNVGFLKSFPPYYLLDENGNPSGFAADVMNAVAKRAGLTVKYRVKENWSEINKALQNGDIDIIPNYGITEQRKDHAAYTVPVDTFRISIFVRKDTNDIKSIDDLSERPVAVLTSNAAHRILKSRGDFHLRVFNDFPKALFALLSTEVDAFVYPESVTWKLARETRVEDHIKVIGKPLKEIKRGMAVHKENLELLAILDKTLRDFVTSPEYRNIYTNWFGKPAPFWTVALVAWIMGGTMLALVVSMFWWRYRASVRMIRMLRDSEKQFKGIFENAGVGVAKISPNGCFLLVNDRFADIVGYDRGELLSVSFGDITHPEDRTCNRVAIKEVLAGRRQNYVTDNRYIRADGSTVWTTLTVEVVRDEHNTPEYLLAVIEDITARKLAEEAARASEDRLAEIFAIAPEAVITIGEDMKVQLFNKGAERIFGYRSEEILGQSMEILMPEHLRRGHQRHIDEFDRSLDTFRYMDQREEITGLRKDGTEFPASASVSKLETGGEKIFTVMLHDVTERRRADEERRRALTEAEEANRAKSEFLAAMSHELRTPLNAISGFSDMLTGEFFGPLGSLKYKEYAYDIRSSSDHLLRLVNDILDLSAIEKGKLTLNKEEISVEKIVKDCSRYIIKAAGMKDIRYAVDVSASLPSLHADQRAIKQILINLLSNAVKFTPDGGQIALSAKVSDRHHIFQIRDNGKGVSKEKLQHLTDAFVRDETDPHKAQEGTGLGLAIVKSFVDLHDGELTIESEVGKGTLITVALPSDMR